MQMPSGLPANVELTAIALAVKVQGLIADLALPRGMPMKKTEFQYTEYDFGQVFTVPDTKVGRRSAPNKVEFKGEPKTDSTVDHALDHGLSQQEIDDAPEGSNLQGNTTEWLTGLVHLSREVRVANLMLDAANYDASNVNALGAGEYFDDPTSDPLALLLEALDTPVMRPTVMSLGAKEWRALRTNPVIVKAVNGNSGDAGAASIKQVMELLELEQILVGRSLISISKPGQDTELATCWKGGISLTYQDPIALRAGGPTYGFTAQTGNFEVVNWFDQNIGRRGGHWVRSGEQVKEKVLAKSLGFLLTDVLTPEV